MADEVSDTGVARTKLAWWRTEVANLFAGHPQHPVTRALMRSGSPLGRTLPGRLGLEIRAVVAGGERILDKIEGVAGDVFRHRPVLGKVDGLVILARAFARRT